MEKIADKCNGCRIKAGLHYPSDGMYSKLIFYIIIFFNFEFFNFFLLEFKQKNKVSLFWFFFPSKSGKEKVSLGSSTAVVCGALKFKVRPAQ